MISKITATASLALGVCLLLALGGWCAYEAGYEKAGALGRADVAMLRVEHAEQRKATAEAYLGTLFYNVDEGSKVWDWVREDSTPTTRAALCVEIETRVNSDPHVETGTARASVLRWDHQSVDINLTLTLIDQDHPENLQLRLGQDNDEPLLEILGHGNPRQDTRP